VSQTVRADPECRSESGSIPIPEWIVITPWPLGSGKFVTPCLRMHAENFASVGGAYVHRDLELAALSSAEPADQPSLQTPSRSASSSTPFVVGGRPGGSNARNPRLRAPAAATAGCS